MLVNYRNPSYGLSIAAFVSASAEWKKIWAGVVRQQAKSGWCADPAGTRRNDNVIIRSKRRSDVILT